MENKYSRGKIYRIDVGEDFYIGSTSKKYLCQRKGAHSESLKKGDPMILYVKMRELGLDFTMVELTLVKNFPCHSKKELEEEEGRVQRKLKPTLNSRIAGRTPEQYYLDNKEELNEKSRLYKINNQEKIAELNRNTNERRKKEKGVCQYCHKEMSLYHLRYNHLKTCPNRPSILINPLKIKYFSIVNVYTSTAPVWSTKISRFLEQLAESIATQYPVI